MKRILIISSAVLLFACNSQTKGDKTTNADSTSASTDSVKYVPVEVDSATQMKNWQEYATPSAMHQMIASWDGTWIGDVTMWMPGEPEQKSTLLTENKMIMNGLYQQSTHTGTMMGMPFNGMSTLAYDNHKNEFVNTWIDNMGSGLMVMNGTYDSTTKTITLKGKGWDPARKIECNMRETFQIVNDSTQVMQMFGPDPKTGAEMKSMEITFKRKK